MQSPEGWDPHLASQECGAVLGLRCEGCHGLDAPRFCTSSTHLCLNSYADLLEGPPWDRERNAAQTGGLWAAECFQR